MGTKSSIDYRDCFVTVFKPYNGPENMAIKWTIKVSYYHVVTDGCLSNRVVLDYLRHKLSTKIWVIRNIRDKVPMANQ